MDNCSPKTRAQVPWIQNHRAVSVAGEAKPHKDDVVSVVKTSSLQVCLTVCTCMQDSCIQTLKARDTEGGRSLHPEL